MSDRYMAKPPAGVKRRARLGPHAIPGGAKAGPRCADRYGRVIDDATPVGAMPRTAGGLRFQEKTVLNGVPEDERRRGNTLERAAGIEPASSAWKAEVLPLHNARLTILFNIS